MKIMTKYLNCLKAVALAFIFGLLAACAHPDSVNLGTSYDSVMDKLGAPDSRTVLPDGTLRLVYSLQPMGQQSFVMIFNKEGHLIFKENLLQQKYFNEIKPKIMNEQDIYNMFGHPCEKWTYALSGEHTYMYRFQDGGMDWALWVDFDNKTNEVLRYVISIDPWTQRDGDDDKNI